MGKTNREIAETLLISPHTAAHHVSAVLRKLAVPSRHVLATLEAKGELEKIANPAYCEGHGGTLPSG
jgi:DNA-binding NarL/FixJ family response regulator